MISVFIIISFYLEGLCSMLFKTPFFFPLFTLLSLVLTYPCFRKYGSTFFKTCLIVGILYDVAYTDTILIHGFLFCVLGFFISLFYRLFDKNFWTILLFSFFIMGVYQIFYYVLFLLAGRVIFSFSMIFNSIVYSVMSNVLYVLILYGVLVLLHRYKRIEFYH